MKIIDGKPTSASSELQQLWAAGEYRKALKLAAGWPRLGDHKVAIERGWCAAASTAFYRQMGKDPDALYAAGLAAVAERYGLPPAKETTP